MVRPRINKEGSFKVIPLNLDKDEYEKFLNNIPRTKSVSEAIRDYIKSVNEESEKIKNVNSPNYSPLKQCNNNKVNTLDKYFPNHIIEWENFKTIVELLPAEERKKLTEIWKHDFTILEMTNKRKDGTKVYPFINGI